MERALAPIEIGAIRMLGGKIGETLGDAGLNCMVDIQNLT
jgi:hypothetical protein